VRSALETLPWVDQDSVKITVSTHEARFRVKEGSEYNEAELLDAMKTKARFPETTVVAKPAEKPAAKPAEKPAK
jgi:hypothetical protein